MIEAGPYRYTEQDALHTIANLGFWWERLQDGLELPSAFIEAMVAQVDLLAEFNGEVVVAEGLHAVELSARRAFDRVRAGAPCAQVLNESLRLLAGAGEALRQADRFGAPAWGTVAQVSRSGGGVPKRAVDEAIVDLGGVVGDVQAARRHHGRPWQALCLWSAEVIDDFAANGHPIGYGSCGENLTLRSIPWRRVRSGVRLRIGEVVCEVSVPALPCANNAQWFRGGDFNLMHHERGAVSRAYATVLAGGSVRAGDPVVLEER